MKVKGQELVDVLKKELGDKINNYQVVTDSYYVLPDKKYVDTILRSTKIDKEGYLREVHDCDDFALLLKGEFIKKGKRFPIAFGIAHGIIGGPHAINFFIDNNKKLHFIEPQTDQYIHKNEIERIWFIYI